MPTYGYRCEKCAHEFEVFQPMSADPLTSCPVCAGRLSKMLYPVGVHFKGSGFYTTDYKTGANSGPKGEGGGGDSAKADSGKGDGAKSESGKGESAGKSEASGGDSGNGGAGKAETSKPAAAKGDSGAKPAAKPAG